jgi:hypothetical protein
MDLTRRLARFTVIDCGFSLEDDEELSYDTLAPRRNAATLILSCRRRPGPGRRGRRPDRASTTCPGLQELGTVASPSPTVVINRVRSSAVGPRPETRIRDALTRFAGIDDPRFIPDDPASLDGALLAGQSLGEGAPDSEVRKTLVLLAREICGEPARHTSRRRKGA